MNLIKFPVTSTNIFPIANSDAGGQLLSEWNIRSRETVGTHSDVKYDIGLSYTHSKDDFKIYQETDGADLPISSSVITISPGKAIVNGHFVQSLAPVQIDILEQNAQLQAHDQAPLVGTIGIGLKVFYSTEATMAGTMMIEDDDMYTGIQVILLPANQLTTPNENATTQTTEGSATCDLKLGTFEFANGTIKNVRPNDARIQFIDGDKISHIDEVISDTYISKAGLNPSYLYVFSGKSSDPRLDTWCIANDSLMVWDTSTPVASADAVHTDGDGARFVQSTDQEYFNLILPHKQVDGLVDGEGHPLYYPDKIINVPAASYADSTAGIVTRSYTNNIKKISSKLANFYQLVKGKQVYYIESLSDINDLPPVNNNWDIGDYVLVEKDLTQDSEYDSYGAPSTLYAVLPGHVQSFTYYGVVEDSDEVPAELTGVELESVNVSAIPVRRVSVAESLSRNYLQHVPVVTPTIYGQTRLILSNTVSHKITAQDLVDAETGQETTSFTVFHNDYNISASGREFVTILSTEFSFNSKYKSKDPSAVQWDAHNKSITFNRLPSNTGSELKPWEECGIYEGDTIVIVVDNRIHPESVSEAVNTLSPNIQFNPATGEITFEGIDTYLSELAPMVLYRYWAPTIDLFSDFASFRGEPFKDYFVATYEYKDDDDVLHTRKYYFVVSSSYPHEWSGPIQLTGAVPFAQEDTIGGFLNVAEDSAYSDGGYVYLDSEGHLRLRDYSLLRSGTLAYQLGEDIPEFGGGEPLSAVQETLNEFINDRIAFPSATQLKESSTPNVIEVVINLTDDTPVTDEDNGYRHIYIRNIDSRFNTSVYFRFTGDATAKTIIDFVDCERIRIDSNVCGSALGERDSYPVINVYRCGLYYDASVMDYIKTCSRPVGEYSYYDFTSDALLPDEYAVDFTGMRDIKLWYQRYNSNEPNLSVDDMTVRELDVAIEAEHIDFWTYLAPNDNHFAAALSSLTFAGDGTIIGCGLLVANNSTENVTQDDTIIMSEFTLPQGEGLTYPASCMTRQLKVTGTFTTAYNTNTSAGWYVTETSFTALTSQYGASESSGSIVLHEKTSIIPSTLTSIPAWETGTYNLFYGGIVSANS